MKQMTIKNVQDLIYDHSNIKATLENVKDLTNKFNAVNQPSVLQYMKFVDDLNNLLGNTDETE